MPWTTDNPPSPAKNWNQDEKERCVAAGNAALESGKTEAEAIYACIHAAGKSERSSEMQDAFFIPTEDSADDVLIFPIGKFYRDGQERQFTPDDAALMVANFKNGVLGESRLPPVNPEHKREAGKIGNVVDLWVSDDGVRGKVDGDLAGFDYISPEVRWQWTHPFTGAKYQNVLMGAGATNYPFFLDRMALNSDSDAMLWTGSDWEPFQDASREELRERRAARAKRYGIGVKEGGNLTPPKDYPTDEGSFLDPVNYRYPCDAAHAQAALIYFNQSEHREQGGYSSAEWAIMGKRGARLMSKHLKASYQFKNGRLQRKEQSMTVSDDDIATEDFQNGEGSANAETDGGNEMSEELKGQVEDIFAKLEKMEGFAELENEVRALKELVAQQDEQEASAEKAEKKAENYAEQLADARSRLDEFSAKLKKETEERERFTELYETERKSRRLAEFTEKTRTWTFAGGEPEIFAEDLMRLEDLDAGLPADQRGVYGRMIQRLDAIDEQMKSGALFEQHSVAGGESTEPDAFLREVEKVRVERFADRPYAEGFTEAMKAAEVEHPDLAREYVEAH